MPTKKKAEPKKAAAKTAPKKTAKPAKAAAKPAKPAKKESAEPVKLESAKPLPLKEKPAPAQEVADKSDKKDLKDVKKNTYIYAVGRRKSAVATVRLFKNGQGNVKVNDKDFREYFTIDALRVAVLSPLVAVGQDDKLDVTAMTHGGGIRGQAEAVRHGISRTLVKLNPNFRKALKKHGFLTRDPRVKERKKPGLKRARRAPQWAKR